MKMTYATWTKIGRSLKIVRRGNTLPDAMKGFRPGNTVVTCAIHKS